MAGVVGRERRGHDPRVGDGQVHPPRAGRRHDVRRIPGQQQAAELHRLDHVAAHRSQPAFEDGTGVHAPALFSSQPRLELVPDALVGPVVQRLVGLDLKIQARDLGRAHAVQREAARVARVDQLGLVGRRGGQDAQPGEGVLPLVGVSRGSRQRAAAEAVEAVAAGDELAVEDLLGAVLGEADLGDGRVDAVDPRCLGFEEDRVAGAEAGRDEVFDDLLLAVDVDGAATRQLGQVESYAAAVDVERQPVMDHALAVQAIGQAELVQQVDRTLLEHAGADAVLDVITRAAF
jgi:hypothetical protein